MQIQRTFHSRAVALHAFKKNNNTKPLKIDITAFQEDSRFTDGLVYLPRATQKTTNGRKGALAYKEMKLLPLGTSLRILSLRSPSSPRATLKETFLIGDLSNKTPEEIGTRGINAIIGQLEVFIPNVKIERRGDKNLTYHLVPSDWRK